MVYALPRKLRTSESHAISHEPDRVSPSSKVERAQELQSVLEASFRGTRPTHDTPSSAASADGTPRRRRVPHAFANHVPPVTSTPLTPRRALRPYPDFPAANWSASQTGSVEKSRRPLSTREPLRSVHPMSILEDDQYAPLAPASSSSSAAFNAQKSIKSKPTQGVSTKAQNSFMPQRKPVMDVAQTESSHILQHPLSPASSTDDPLLIHDSLMSNMTIHAAQGDSDLVAMVRQFEHDDLAQLPSPSPNAPASALRRRADSHTPTPLTPPIHGKPSSRSSLARRQATPDAHRLQATPTPARYDRSLGLRERIAMLKSPSKPSRGSTPTTSRITAPEQPSVDTSQRSMPIFTSVKEGSDKVVNSEKEASSSAQLRSAVEEEDSTRNAQSPTRTPTALAQNYSETHPKNSPGSKRLSSRSASRASPHNASRYWQSPDHQQTPASSSQSTRTRQSLSSVGLLPWGAGSPTRHVTPRSTPKIRDPERTKSRTVKQAEHRRSGRSSRVSQTDSKSTRQRPSTTNDSDDERPRRHTSAAEEDGDVDDRQDRDLPSQSRSSVQVSDAEALRSDMDDLDWNDEAAKSTDHRLASDEHDERDEQEANGEHDSDDANDANDEHDRLYTDPLRDRVPDEDLDAEHRVSDDLGTDHHAMNEQEDLSRVSDQHDSTPANDRFSEDRDEDRSDQPVPQELSNSRHLSDPEQTREHANLPKDYDTFVPYHNQHGKESAGAKSQQQHQRHPLDAMRNLRQTQDSPVKPVMDHSLEESVFETEPNFSEDHINEPNSELDAFVFERVSSPPRSSANQSVSADFHRHARSRSAALDFPFERVSAEDANLAKPSKPRRSAQEIDDYHSFASARFRGNWNENQRALQAADQEEDVDGQDDNYDGEQDVDDAGDQDVAIQDAALQEAGPQNDYYVGAQEEQDHDQHIALQEEEEEQYQDQQVNMQETEDIDDQFQAQIDYDERVDYRDVFHDHRAATDGDEHDEDPIVDEQELDNDAFAHEHIIDDENFIVDQQDVNGPYSDSQDNASGANDADDVIDATDSNESFGASHAVKASDKDRQSTYSESRATPDEWNLDDNLLEQLERDLSAVEEAHRSVQSHSRSPSSSQETHEHQETRALAMELSAHRTEDRSFDWQDQSQLDEFHWVKEADNLRSQIHTPYHSEKRRAIPLDHDRAPTPTHQQKRPRSVSPVKVQPVKLSPRQLPLKTNWSPSGLNSVRSSMYTKPGEQTSVASAAHPHRTEFMQSTPVHSQRQALNLRPHKAEHFSSISPQVDSRLDTAPSVEDATDAISVPGSAKKLKSHLTTARHPEQELLAETKQGNPLSARGVNRHNTRLPILMSKVRTAYVKDAAEETRETIVVGDEDVSANASTVVIEDESESPNADAQQTLGDPAYTGAELDQISIATSPSKRRRIDPESVRDSPSKQTLSVKRVDLARQRESLEEKSLPMQRPPPSPFNTIGQEPNEFVSARRSPSKNTVQNSFEPPSSRNIGLEPSDVDLARNMNQDLIAEYRRDPHETYQAAVPESPSKLIAPSRSPHYTPILSVTNRNLSSSPNKTSLHATPRLPSSLAQDIHSFRGRAHSPDDWELTPSPAVSSPEVAPEEPMHDSLADLSASLSASSYARARMLARPRPTACVEIASLDPYAAARAAAILRVHHQYIQEGWLRQQASDSFDMDHPQLDASSENTHLPALLTAAEYGERNDTRLKPPGTPYLPGAFPQRSARKISAPRVTAHALRPQARAGKWSEYAWSELDRHLQMELYRAMEQQPQQTYREVILNLDADRILGQFFHAEGLEPDDLQGEWKLSRLQARIPALQVRLLRRWDQLAGVDSDQQIATTLRRKSFSALANNWSMDDGLVSGNAQIFARDPELEKANCSEPTVDAMDITQGTQASPSANAPTRSETSFVSQILSKVWPRKSTSTRNVPIADHSTGSNDDLPAERSEQADSLNATQQDKSHSSMFSTTQVPTYSSQTSARGWPSRNGTSSVQSTAFSALGAQAQQQATITAQRFAQGRARDWQSPRQRRHNLRTDLDVGNRAPRAAYVAARNRFLERPPQ